MIIADEDFKKSTTSYVLGKALRISEIIVGEVIDYRADVVVMLGKDHVK